MGEMCFGEARTSWELTAVSSTRMGLMPIRSRGEGECTERLEIFALSSDHVNSRDSLGREGANWAHEPLPQAETDPARTLPRTLISAAVARAAYCGCSGTGAYCEP